jgi:hypothetical protein
VGAVGLVASPADEAGSRRKQRISAARKACLVLVFVGVFLTFGVPRWLERDAGPAGSPAGASFPKLCRDHGGTPTTAPGSGTRTRDQRCTVRYGSQVYLMDAITAAGFDEDTARFQRQGCEEARREQKASTAPGHRGRSFIYHPTTGVCEHRP